METGWESCSCSAWRRKACVETSVQPSSIYVEAGQGLSVRNCGNGARNNGFELKQGKFRFDIGRILFYGGGEELEQVVQGGCGCPNPGGIQSQAG